MPLRLRLNYVTLCDLYMHRKLLVRDSPTVADLEGVDFNLVRSLDMMRNIRSSPEVFASTFFETFTTTTSDDRTVELLPNGAQTDVTYESRGQYCDLATNVSPCLHHRLLRWRF